MLYDNDGWARQFTLTQITPLTLEVMEEILTILTVLLLWRVVVSTLGAVALAIVLSNVLPFFTAGYCITLAIFGVAFGVYWQGRAESGISLSEPVEEPKISAPVAFLGYAFLGLMSGGVIGELFASKVIGSVGLLLGVAVVALWYGHSKRSSLSHRSVAFAVASTQIGYCFLLVLVAWRTP